MLSNAELYQRVALERERSYAILANVADGIVAVDREGKVVLWNESAETITGVPAEAALGRTPVEVLQRELASGATSTAGERLLSIQRGGDEVWLSLTEAVMHDPVGSVSGRIFAFRNVSSERIVEQMKSTFVSTVSHQLRAPLTSIYGFAETLLRRDVLFGDEERRTFLEYIASEAQRLTSIVDQLLSVARLEAGDMQVELVPTDLREVVSDAVASVRDAAAVNGHRFVLELPEEPLAASADREKLGQILRNLLDNAVKFSPGGGTVTVEAYRRAGASRGPRRRPGRGHPRGRAGAHLLEVPPRGQHRRQQRGRARALHRPRSRPGHGRAHLGRLGRGRRIELCVRTPTRRSDCAGREREYRTGMAARVLVIDDEAPIRLLCRVNLEAAGMVVHEAADGVTGVEIARRETPDVILLDVMMPGMDGWDVFGLLLEEERTAKIPVVFLTARAELRDQARGLELGGVDYVTKPFDPLELAPLIDDLLDRLERGALQERRRERLAVLRQLLVND